MLNTYYLQLVQAEAKSGRGPGRLRKLKRGTKVFINTLDGKKLTMFFENNDTVSDFCKKIADQLGWEASVVKLVYQGKMITKEDKKPRETLLTSYGVAKFDNFQLIMKSKGGR